MPVVSDRRAARLAAEFRVMAFSIGLAIILLARDAGLREQELVVRERAIRQLTQRGATVIEWLFSAAPDSVLVSFPLGEHDRRTARKGWTPFRCMMSIRRYSEPAMHLPPMTDADLDLLLQIPDLERVDFGGATVTDAAMANLRRALPGGLRSDGTIDLMPSIRASIEDLLAGG